ncbi:MAG: hypothetical protein KKC99_01800 [Proteobacteria bacterium]|nr:hypothetical protein [Pseudomonadota bacterium]
MFQKVVLSFMGYREEGQRSGDSRAQGEGEYCRGVHVDDCRTTFGEALHLVCATCPN